MSKVVVMQHGRLEQHILNHEALASGTGNTQKLKGSEEIVCKALLFLLPGIFPQISGWLMPADVSLSYVLLCVIYFIYHNALQVYSCCHRCQGFFSNACIMHSVVYIPRFPSASLQQWALGPFLYLGYFDSCRSEHGSTNIFQIPTLLFLDFVPKSRHAGKVVLLLICCGNSILFSTVAEPTSAPTKSARGSPLHILTNTCYL